MKSTVRIFALSVALIAGAFIAGGVLFADGTVQSLLIYPNSDTANAISLRINDTAGTAQLSMTAAGVATFTSATVFSGGITSSGALTATGAGATSTASTASYGGTSVVIEGATADASEGTLTFGDFSADYTYTFAAAGSFLISGATLADPTTVSTASYGNNGFTVEGTADAFETSLTAVDPTSDNAFVLAAAGSFIVPGATLADPTTASSASYGGNGFTVEGSADAFETSLTAVDPTADNGYILGAAGDFRIPGVAVADPSTASMASYGGTGLTWEGTADGFEGTLSFGDVTADRSWTFGAAGDFLVNGTATADPTTASLTAYGSSGIVWEGTADGFEGGLTFADPSQDFAVTIGAAGQITSSGTGTIGWTVVDGADNTACDTGICTSAAVFGIDLAGGATAPVIVSAGSAASDVCLCAGAS